MFDFENCFSVHDGIMRGFTFEDAVMILRNVNPERGDVWEIMKKEMCEWARDNMEIMLHDLEAHKADVWAEAFPDEQKALLNHPNWPEERVEALVNDVKDWLIGAGLWLDVFIYYNGKRMSFTNNGTAIPNIVIEEDKDPRDYFEYVGNPHIMSMSFEGNLYEVLNYYSCNSDKMEAEFDALLKRHGCYYTLGHAWDLSCYEV